MRNLNNYLIDLQPRPMESVSEARKLARSFWRENGVSYGYLVSKPDDNAKLAKSGAKGGMATYGLSLAPATVSGMQTCNWSTPLCRKGCLNTAGKGELPKVQRGRILKTQFLADNPQAFLRILITELQTAVKVNGRILMRLNVLSDLDWHRIFPLLFDIPGVEYYDYTKDIDRMHRYLNGELPVNYRLLFSASERSTDDDLANILAWGGNVAMVFDKNVPDVYLNRVVIDGDKSDDRYHDRGGVIVGLKAKGRMRNPEYVKGGFVR